MPFHLILCKLLLSENSLWQIGQVVVDLEELDDPDESDELHMARDTKRKIAIITVTIVYAQPVLPELLEVDVDVVIFIVPLTFLNF